MCADTAGVWVLCSKAWACIVWFRSRVSDKVMSWAAPRGDELLLFWVKY